MTLTREVFLSKRELRRIQVDIPEWGESVWVRELNAKQRGEVEMAFTSGDHNRVAGVRAAVVTMCTVNDEGVPMFKPGDQPAIAEMSGSVIDRIFSAALKVSGLGEGAHESAVGNLPAPPPDALQ